MNIEDPIAIEDGSITIRTGITTEGHRTWTIDILGDLDYITTQGLLTEAQHDMREIYDEE